VKYGINKAYYDANKELHDINKEDMKTMLL